MRAVVLLVLLTVAAVEVLRPVHSYPSEIVGHHREANATVAVVLPNGVIVLFALLSLVFLVGVRAHRPHACTSAGRWRPSAAGARASGPS